MTPEEIQKLIDDSIAEAMKLATDKRCDTPTDDLQVVNKKYVDTQTSKTFIGIFNADGTKTALFPTGWSLVRNGSGDFTITHNLGTTSYSMVAVSQNDETVLAVLALNANDVKVRAFVSHTGSSIDSTTNFILVKL